LEVLSADEVLQAAKAAGFGRTTLFEAKKRLGVKPRRVGGAAEKGFWEWSLPVEAPPVEG
jgi:hypothetical protein